MIEAKASLMNEEVLSNIPSWKLGAPLYENPLATADDLKDFRLEGQAILSYPDGRLRLENALDPSLKQAANYVLWCPEDFPDNVCFSWDFWPLREPGLSMFFFAAAGRNGEDLFSPGLAPRSGDYEHYIFGDMNALHLSYFRRGRHAQFNTCNLRKSHGFHLVAQGADPIPSVQNAVPPYQISLWKRGPRVVFAVCGLAVLDWTDPAGAFGPVLAGGKVGFRQMSPLQAEYANFTVRPILE
jgi:hypothetical protein